MISVSFTDNARQDIADINTFHVFIQKIPENVADDISITLIKKSNFLLTNLLYSGKSYGYKGKEEIRTIVILPTFGRIKWEIDNLPIAVN